MTAKSAAEKIQATVSNNVITLGDVDLIAEDPRLTQEQCFAARRYVIATWVNGARKEVRSCHRFSVSEYNEIYPNIVERLFDSAGTRLIVLVEKPGATTFHAWLISDTSGRILYAYVPPELRRYGFFNAMCEVIQCQSHRKNNHQMELACLFPFPVRKPHRTIPHLQSCLAVCLPR